MVLVSQHIVLWLVFTGNLLDINKNSDDITCPSHINTVDGITTCMTCNKHICAS